ncbi:MAG: DegV family protein [Anaerolineae bacterium]|nr:DegV family protein [Anaerolineae bacterium]
MSKIAVVTDSTADIPEEIAAGKPIFKIPLQIVWDGVTFQDGVDINPVEFYARLRSGKTLPTTSQPSPEKFKALYSQLLEKGYEILSVHISSRLSGTINAALQAKGMLAGAPIEVVDSLTSSIALGMQVLTAAEAALRGDSLLACKTLVEQARERAGIFFVLETLEYLRRGGRIGGAAAFLGALLNIHPILETRNGIIDAVDRTRSLRKGLNRVIDLLEKRVEQARSINLAVVHANTPVEAQAFLDQAVQRLRRFNIQSSFCTYVSPVLATHTGPAGLGLAFLYE